MKPSAYFHDKVKTFLNHPPDKTLNAGINVANTIIVAYTANDYQNTLEAWLQGRHDIWQNRIDAYKSNLKPLWSQPNPRTHPKRPR